jgi:DNA-binding transcriptional ArsR family regulator
MQAFNELRKHAREKRDKAIDVARNEYAATLVRISALEQDLLGRESSTHQTIASCINRVLPTDREFTTIDVMTALEALDPRRPWRKRSVDSHISRLRERGLVRRLRKSKGLEPAVYARVGVQVAPMPFGDKTLPEVIGEVLAGRTLTQTELAVAMLDAGYQTTMTPKALRDAVGVVLRRERGQFVQRGGKWASRAAQSLPA